MLDAKARMEAENEDLAIEDAKGSEEVVEGKQKTQEKGKKSTKSAATPKPLAPKAPQEVSIATPPEQVSAGKPKEAKEARKTKEAAKEAETPKVAEAQSSSFKESAKEAETPQRAKEAETTRKLKEKEDETPSRPKEVEETRRSIEETARSRREEPPTPVPPMPLFSEEQVKQYERMMQQAPFFFQRQMERQLEAEGSATMYRPAFLAHEENRMAEERRRFNEMMEEMRRVRDDNLRLQRRVEELEQRGTVEECRFSTPDETSVRRELQPQFSKEKLQEKEDSSEEAETPKESPRGGEPGQARSDPQQDVTTQIILKLMQGMQEIQRKLVTRTDRGEGGENEHVRQGHELPKLAEWTLESGPIDFNDWLTYVTPAMQDLSESSELWWAETLRTARAWYEAHMKLSPIQRLSHEPTPTDVMKQKKWSRVERRATSMLMLAIPEPLKEEIVASKSLSVLGVLTKGMLMYQPGGMTEKTAILTSLESPAEAQTISAGISTLRRWMRWRRRAEEVGVSLPDATVLVRGLAKLSRKITQANPDLQFRLALVRNSLLIDTCPSQETVVSYAENMLAEMEQMGQAARKKESPQDPPPKLKRVEDASKEEPGKERKEDEREKPVCRFFLTDGGCKRGKSCKWSHDVKDEKRRCWTCGAVDHMSSQCPRRSNSESPRKGKVLKSEEKTPNATALKEAEEDADQSMKGLLEEASRMLKNLSSDTVSSSSTMTVKEEEVPATRKEVLEKLEQRLKRMKTFRIRRINHGSIQGLVDSGATHALRPKHKNESLSSFSKVDVNLANGSVVTMFMTRGGVMVSEDASIEPIIPMGALVEKLGCSLSWEEGEMQITHPVRGRLPITVCDGCPQIPRTLALSLIEELEEVAMAVGLKTMQFEGENQWLKKLVETHEMLKSLPKDVKDELAVPIGMWSHLPGNKRQRKYWKRHGLIVHMYAGPDEGFTLQRAWKQQGGDPMELLELDIQRDLRHNLLQNEVYGGLLRAAMEGKLKSLVGGPNCRTRSLLRHIPIPGRDDFPRPVRRWGNDEEFGIKDATEEEKLKVWQDDVLAWRMIFLYMVASYVSQVTTPEKKIGFGLEQPAEPVNMPEVVSLWRTKEWKSFKAEFQLEEITFDQKDLGGKSRKRTTFGTNLCMKADEHRMKGVQEVIYDSKDLSRWSPGTMSMVARALLEHEGRKVKIHALSWQEHVEHGHVPYRRDCLTCQQALQQCLPYRRVRHPMGVLSFDTAGPLKVGQDVEGKSRYFLCGALIWMVPKHSEKLIVEDPPEDEEQDGRDEMELEDKREEDLAAGGTLSGTRPRGRPRGTGKAKDDDEETDDERFSDGPDPIHEEHIMEEPGEEMSYRVFRLALPMASKDAREVTSTAMEMVLQLRADGYHVGRIHTDRGHEFAKHFKKWALNRGIHVSKTPGDDPRVNGRVEVAIKSIKTHVRRLLIASGLNEEYWPLALRHVHALNRCYWMDSKPTWPTFNQKVLVRKRRWNQGDFQPTMEEVYYVAPSPENHGHWIREEGGLIRLTRSLLKKGTIPPNEDQWLAIERETLDELAKRRRLREKTSVRKLEGIMKNDDEEDLQKKRRNQILRLIEEEMRIMVNDPPEVVLEEMLIISKMKQLIELEHPDDEEVLQTRVVSTKEVRREWDAWKKAAQAEVDALLTEKEALKMVDKAEVETMIREAHQQGRKVEILPSKLVCVKKPGKGGGRPKIRWVICGNYEEKNPMEDTYSSGADAAAFRLLLVAASENQWEGSTLDVKVAFLNAVMKSEEQESLILVKSPQLLVEKEVIPPSVHFLPLRAVYGLRRSPKLWGNTRDEEMRMFRVKHQVEGRKMTLKLVPLMSEPNLWKLVEDRSQNEDEVEEEKYYGLVMTYVDDLFITSTKELTQKLHAVIQGRWETSTPDWVSLTPIRFLGMQISKKKDDAKDREVWYLSQESYIKELVQRGGERVKTRKVPITRDQGIVDEVEEEGRTEEKIKLAQRQVGELLWLVTRTRPDVMFPTSRAGSMSMKHPSKVEEIYFQTLGYLKSTESEGLKFDVNPDEVHSVDSFTDASFAPEGEESHGAFCIMVKGCLIFWRSGRQNFTTLSTAEAELVETVEGMIAGESISTVAFELFGNLPHRGWTDNQAVVAIVTQDGGSWRTRHLKMRAASAREAVASGRWTLQHQKGETMIADIGTKALSSTRLDLLKKEMKMERTPVDSGEISEEKEEKTRKIETAGGKEAATMVVRMIMLAAAIKEAKGQPQEGREESRFTEFNMMVMMYTMAVIAVTILLQWMWKVGVRRPRTTLLSHRGRGNGNSPAPEEVRREVQEEVRREVSDEMRREIPEEVRREVNEVRREVRYEVRREVQDEVRREVRREEERREGRGERSQGVQNLERRMWDEIRADPQRHLQEAANDVNTELPFTVRTTKTGVVYHESTMRSYLKNPKVGGSRESRWCPLCKKVSMATRQTPKRGDPLFITGWGHYLHNFACCPMRRDDRLFPMCTKCYYEGGLS
eukprot:Skav227164  [mRNA]  locus=scaffold502:278286:285743:- [translate_table: standard]